MLGDGGANALGCGGRLGAREDAPRTGALAGDRRSRCLNYLGETRSIGRLIDETPWLRRLDRLGRGSLVAQRGQVRLRHRRRRRRSAGHHRGIARAPPEGTRPPRPGRFDPYLNVDPGTMSPFQHGEVFVTEDGAETDLDIGHYERFVGKENLSERQPHLGLDLVPVIRKERRGRVPRLDGAGDHRVTNEIKDRIRRVAASSTTPTSSSPRSAARSATSSRCRSSRRSASSGARRGPERDVRPRHVRPVHRDGRRAEDEADATLRQQLRRIGVSVDVVVFFEPDEGLLARHPRQDRALRRRWSRAP